MAGQEGGALVIHDGHAKCSAALNVQRSSLHGWHIGLTIRLLGTGGIYYFASSHFCRCAWAVVSGMTSSLAPPTNTPILMD